MIVEVKKTKNFRQKKKKYATRVNIPLNMVYVIILLQFIMLYRPRMPFSLVSFSRSPVDAIDIFGKMCHFKGQGQEFGLLWQCAVVAGKGRRRC